MLSIANINKARKNINNYNIGNDKLLILFKNFLDKKEYKREKKNIHVKVFF